MQLDDLKKLMPDADDTTVQTALEKINADAQALVDNEVKGLKENKEKLLTQMSTLKKNQAPDDYDPEAFKEFMEKKDKLDQEKREIENKALEDKGQWDALKLKLNESHQAEIERIKNEFGTEVEHLSKALDTELIENAAIKAIEKEKGNSFFLLPHMKDKMKTVKNEDGKFAVQILDESGNPRLKDDATTPFGVEDFVAELKVKETFAPAFPEMNSGSGSVPNTGSGGAGGNNPWKTETKNVTEQARLNKENPTLAAQFKKQAGVK